MITIKELIRKKVLKFLGLVQYDVLPDPNRLVFINDEEAIKKMKLAEYDTWYDGDGDELLNFYTGQSLYTYNYEPFYTRNKKNYFWAISAQESKIKRTHSGQPRNIVDTLVSIIPFPDIHAAFKGQAVDDHLREIYEEANVSELYRTEQLPLALVEGWGCWKINWNMDLSDNPIPVYYRAENVDFEYVGNKVVGVIFKDFYTNDKDKFMLLETRRLEARKDDEGKPFRVLVIEKSLYKLSADNQNASPVEFNEVPELSDIQKYIEIGPCDILLAVPVILLPNTANKRGYGRSIFTGKIDLFDDLDQCLSQAANSVRLSTPIEYVNTEYMERDRHGLPKRPNSYDRKYVQIEGGKDADGNSKGDPVQVTQPNINFEQYSQQAVQILLQICNGIISPATLGIDIAKKDNAEAQREKEKVTIFMRNMIIAADEKIQKSLASQLLAAWEFMHTGKITVEKYDVTVAYSEFADASYENKLETLCKAYDAMDISDEMFINKLYGHSLSEKEKDDELKWLKENHSQPRQEGMEGMSGGGANAPGMLQNMMGGGDEDDNEMI